jgi:hypothetical protein
MSNNMNEVIKHLEDIKSRCMTFDLQSTFVLTLDLYLSIMEEDYEKT